MMEVESLEVTEWTRVIVERVEVGLKAWTLTASR